MIGEIDFYQSPYKDYRRRIEVGQFFLAPVPFQFSNSRVHLLRLDYYDKSNPENSSYTIELIDFKRFDPRTRKPIYELRLSSDEFVFCVPHKLRPVIVLSNAVPDWQDYATKRGEHFLVVPLYSAKDVAGNYRFSEKFLNRTQAYEYPSLFYLPESTEYDVNESLVRFDRVFYTNSNLLKPQPRKLSEEATTYIIKWFQFFNGCELDELLHIYRELALQTIQEDG